MAYPVLPSPLNPGDKVNVVRGDNMNPRRRFKFDNVTVVSVTEHHLTYDSGVRVYKVWLGNIHSVTKVDD